MTKKTQLQNSQDGFTQFLLYTTPNGKVQLEVFLNDETIWLTQAKMAELFGVTPQNITTHLKNIFAWGELLESATCKEILQVRQEGDRMVQRNTKYYHLDAILSVGYRINSTQATQFRIWATERLREYIIKGFTMDDERLKNGHHFGKDYFRELLERIHSIRSSERRIYQQVTDIFAECSTDYDKNSDTAKHFYAMIQNKFHFAIVGKTAAEIVFETADNEQPFMGLKTWKNSPKGRVLKSDTTIAKNYLEENEIKKLERTVSGYFDYIENLVEHRTTLTMEDLALSVNRFLEFNEYRVLEGKGRISHEQAEQKAFAEYEVYNKKQVIESDFDQMVKSLSSNLSE